MLGRQRKHASTLSRGTARREYGERRSLSRVAIPFASLSARDHPEPPLPSSRTARMCPAPYASMSSSSASTASLPSSRTNAINSQTAAHPDSILQSRPTQLRLGQAARSDQSEVHILRELAAKSVHLNVISIPIPASSGACRLAFPRSRSGPISLAAASACVKSLRNRCPYSLSSDVQTSPWHSPERLSQSPTSIVA